MARLRAFIKKKKRQLIKEHPPPYFLYFETSLKLPRDTDAPVIYTPGSPLSSRAHRADALLLLGNVSVRHWLPLKLFGRTHLNVDNIFRFWMIKIVDFNNRTLPLRLSPRFPPCDRPTG